MKLRKRGRILVSFCLLAVTFSLAALAESAPTLFNFQGRLANTTGAPVTSPQNVRIRLIQGGTASEAVSTGTVVYIEDATVTPDSNGVFAHVVGRGTPAAGQTLTETDFLTNGLPLFVEMSLGGSTLLPRTQVLSTGYAMEASRLDGMSAAEIIGQTGGNAYANMIVRNGAGLEWLSNSQVRIKAGTLGFNDGKVRRNTTPLTFDFANGATLLGLDTGTKAASTWYYLYAVPNPADDTKFSAIGSKNSPFQVGGTGPAGYGVHRYVGAIKTDGLANVRRFYRRGDTVSWGGLVSDFSWVYLPSTRFPATQTWITVDASMAIPETSSAAELNGYYDAWCSAAIMIYVGPGAAPPPVYYYFTGDWQNGATTEAMVVPTVDRKFSYYAELQSGWSNDNCQYANGTISGYVEDLGDF